MTDEELIALAGYLRREWGLFILPPMILAVAVAVRALVAERGK